MKRAVVASVVVTAALAAGYAAHELDLGSTAPTPAAQILVLLNQRRAKLHLVPLKRDLVLASLARGHVRDMRRDGFWSHDHPQGQTFAERLAYLKRRLIGEVQAYGTGGFGTAQGLVNLWGASPPHRKVILTPGMRRVGCSVITGPFLGQPGVSVAVCDFSS